jgi:hypothetical protein
VEEETLLLVTELETALPTELTTLRSVVNPLTASALAATTHFWVQGLVAVSQVDL